MVVKHHAKKSLLVIAGEVSGDMHAAKAVRNLQQLDPDLEVWGIGGDELRKCGMEQLYGVADMAVMGLSEVLRRYGFFKKVFAEMCREAEKRRPDAILLVDYPGFNLRFAKYAHELGLTVIYYICPQVWAWHRSRIPAMARIVNRLLVIFPFETEVFSGTGLRVDFVGHPLVDECRRALAEPEQKLPWDAGKRRVALLPGSRKQEVARILPVMIDAATHLGETNSAISFILAAPSEEIAAEARSIIASGNSTSQFEVVTGQTREILRQARVAMVASGTATIEAALMGCPMVVIYRTTWLTYLLGRMLVQVPHIGMVNIVAGREICPEFIQHAATGSTIAEAVGQLLNDNARWKTMCAELREVATKLGTGERVSERVAEFLLEELGGEQPLQPHMSLSRK